MLFVQIDVFRVRQNVHDVEVVSFGFSQPRLIGNTCLS